mgnify:CR=1 FL=1
MTTKQTAEQRARAAGYRSGLEDRTAAHLDHIGCPYEYEQHPVFYTKPARKRRYTPDFLLPNGIVIETKGRFVTADRQKHILIKQQHPDLDVRFVFSNPNTKISKTSKTTYAMWCDKHGFMYAKADIPSGWIAEPTDPIRQEALRKAGIK